VFLSVIPSEARDLLLAKSQEKSRCLAACGGSERQVAGFFSTLLEVRD
jgi:hypothetical protein